jgi:hypothetical protein
MEFWTKSRLIFNSFRDNAKASIRQVARQTGLSKSSVHRLGQSIARRNQHPESWFWETEEGRHWLIRLVVAVLYMFGLKRGVGAETMSAFFACLPPGPACGVFAQYPASDDGAARAPHLGNDRSMGT